jgi:TIR domain
MLSFVSHSQKDRAIYSLLCGALDAAKLDRWDPSTMSAGKSLADQLRNAINECYACVFLATRQSVASSWCLAEVGAFWGAGKRVILFMGESGLTDADLPPQFKGSLWTDDIEYLIRELAREAQRPAMRIAARPANLFWLGHDLARAIRFAMYAIDDRNELDKNLRNSIHHLDQVGVVAVEARRLLLRALKTYRASTALTAEERENFIDDIATAKNELGGKIAELDSAFKPYPTIEDSKRLNQQLDDCFA